MPRPSYHTVRELVRAERRAPARLARRRERQRSTSCSPAARRASSTSRSRSTRSSARGRRRGLCLIDTSLPSVRASRFVQRAWRSRSFCISAASGPWPVRARRLHHAPAGPAGRVREEGAEPLAELALEHVRVPVAVRAERRGRVVDVQRAQAVEPDPGVDLVQRPPPPRPARRRRRPRRRGGRSRGRCRAADGRRARRRAPRARRSSGRSCRRRRPSSRAGATSCSEQRSSTSRSAGTQRSTPAFEARRRGASRRGRRRRPPRSRTAASTVERIVATALAVDRLVRRREVAEVERVHEHGADARLARAARGSGRDPPRRARGSATSAGSARRAAPRRRRSRSRWSSAPLIPPEQWAPKSTSIT